jgi:hypothetical protein
VNVAAAFDALNGNSKLSAVALTDSSALAITYAQLINDTEVAPFRWTVCWLAG